MLGVTVKIMLPHDPTGKNGAQSKKQSDVVVVHDPVAPKVCSARLRMDAQTVVTTAFHAIGRWQEALR